METEKLLAQNFAEDHPSEAALILERLTPREASAYLDELPPRLGERVLQRMVPSAAAECMTLMAPQRFAQIISTLPLNHAAALLRHLDLERQTDLLGKAPSHMSGLLQRLLRYPEASAGALMDPRILALPEDITATEAQALVRWTPRDVLYYLYILDRDQRLVGVMNLRELMMASPRATLNTAMHRQVMTLAALAGRLTIIEHPGWRDVHALPVVDDEGVFLGVVRYETLQKLQRDGESPRQTSGALAVMLTLGELCWVGLAAVLTESTLLVAAPPGEINREKGSVDG